MNDRRLTPANDRVAHVSLRGKLDGRVFVDGVPARVAIPLVDVLARPHGPRDRQILLGDRVRVLDRAGGFAFVRADKDGYCGYVVETALGEDRPVTHWIAAPASHIYSAPDIKAPERAALSLGAQVAVVDEDARFCMLAGGGYVPTCHLRAVGDWADDPVTVAESLVGTPYLWGGNTHAGVDCSGLVQGAFLACGLACPGDSDLQEAAFDPAPDAGLRRGDLVFWKGHVALADGGGQLVHANAFHMAVTVEPAEVAIARIADQGGGAPTSFRRPR